MNNWVSVGQIEPPEYQPILVFNGHRQFVAWLEDGAWFYSDCCGCRVFDVTHWQPLPSPPEVNNG